jgi:hypothetical protein
LTARQSWITQQSTKSLIFYYAIESPDYAEQKEHHEKYLPSPHLSLALAEKKSNFIGCYTLRQKLFRKP